jgi:hypothetical protein
VVTEPESRTAPHQPPAEREPLLERHRVLARLLARLRTRGYRSCRRGRSAPHAAWVGVGVVTVALRTVARCVRRGYCRGRDGAEDGVGDAGGARCGELGRPAHARQPREPCGGSTVRSCLAVASTAPTGPGA